jgi:hypothetical protein
VTDLRATLALAIDEAQASGLVVPDDLIGAVKTYAFYVRTLNRLVGELYRGDISEAAFADGLLSLMDEQLDRAWREGMRIAGKDPRRDMTTEMADELEQIKLNELLRIEGFASAIAQASSADAANETPGASLDGLRSRGEMWADRYNEVRNQAVIRASEPTDRLVWRLGETEEHCGTCSALNRWVQTADWWDKFGVLPQNPPNPALECGGWRCECSLEPTELPISEGNPL